MAAHDPGSDAPAPRPQRRPALFSKNGGSRVESAKQRTDQHLHELWQVLGLDDEDE